MNGAQVRRVRTRAERRLRDVGSVEGHDAANRRRHVMRHLVQKHRGLCAICNEPVSFKLGAPNYATIDHIVALSRGGLDVPSNYQLACHICNQRKGAGP